MRKSSNPQHRVAVGYIDKDDTAIGIMEWELGSRATGDIIAENEPVIGEPTLRNRIALAMPAKHKPEWLAKMEVTADSLVEMYCTLESEEEEVYLCEEWIDDSGVPKLALVQLYPVVKDEDKRNWIVDVDLVEFACDKYADVVELRKAARAGRLDDEANGAGKVRLTNDMARAEIQ